MTCPHRDAACVGRDRSVLLHVCSACLDDTAKFEDGSLEFRAELACLCPGCNPAMEIPARLRQLPTQTGIFGGFDDDDYDGHPEFNR